MPIANLFILPNSEDVAAGQSLESAKDNIISSEIEQELCYPYFADVDYLGLRTNTFLRQMEVRYKEVDMLISEARWERAGNPRHGSSVSARR